MSGFLGAVVFLLVTGALTLLLMAVLGRGLIKAWAERKALQRQAQGRGWRYLGGGSYSAADGENNWRADVQSDSDSARTWTDFRGGVPGLEPGGFVILDKRLSKPASGRPVPTSWSDITPATGVMGSNTRVLASEPRWAELLSPEIESLWLKHLQLAPWPLSVVGRGHVLHLHRDDDGSEASPAQTEALIALGEALLQRVRPMAKQPG